VASTDSAAQPALGQVRRTTPPNGLHPELMAVNAYNGLSIYRCRHSMTAVADRRDTGAHNHANGVTAGLIGSRDGRRAANEAHSTKKSSRRPSRIPGRRRPSRRGLGRLGAIRTHPGG
jgi:hypothetical protein